MMFNLELWWRDICEKYDGYGYEICMGYRRENFNEPTFAMTHLGQTLEEADAKISDFKGVLLRMDGSVEYRGYKC